MSAPFRLGLVVTVLALVADQASKLWLLFGVRLGEVGPIPLAPFAELRLIWNYGISYGLFQAESDVGRWVLFVFSIAASIGLLVWMARAQSRVLAIGLGLIVGGAIGNAIDRGVWGAVVDFAHLFLPDRSRSWYVFNLADVWIVVGVVALLYDSVVSGPTDATKSGSS